VTEGLLRMSPSSLQSAIEDQREAEAARKIDLLFTLAAVAETTASLVLITDAEDRIEWVNPSFTRVTGWTLDEVEGLTPREVLNRSDSEQSPEWEAARTQRLRGEPVGNIEIKLYRKNGQPYWALVEVRPMPDESGAVRRYLHLQTDTTERVLAERRAKETYRWLQLAGSVLGLGLWHTSLPDGAMLWDANLKSIFGLPPDAPTPSSRNCSIATCCRKTSRWCAGRRATSRKPVPIPRRSSASAAPTAPSAPWSRARPASSTRRMDSQDACSAPCLT
jgi:PAS domain S-box-containing protein